MNAKVNKSIIAILILLIFMHISAILGFIPREYLWGGNIKDHDLFIKMEVNSILLLLFMIGINVIKLRSKFYQRYRPVMMSDMFFGVFFSISAIVNLMSLHLIESIISVPVAASLAFLYFKSRKSYS